MGIHYSQNLNYYFWLILMPPYIYQAIYGFLQSMNYCSLPDDSVILDHVSYEKIVNSGNAAYILNLLMM